jgi:hypothetical protein
MIASFLGRADEVINPSDQGEKKIRQPPKTADPTCLKRSGSIRTKYSHVISDWFERLVQFVTKTFLPILSNFVSDLHEACQAAVNILY